MALAYLYGTSGDVREELGNPAELEYSAEDIADSRTKATNLVNLYVSKAYPTYVPFTLGSCPEPIHEITNDLAVYYAKRRKHPGPGPLSEDVKAEYYDKSIKLLELIRDGDVTFTELETNAPDAGYMATRSSYTPIFDVDQIENHVIDKDLEDHIDDERS